MLKLEVGHRAWQLSFHHIAGLCVAARCFLAIMTGECCLLVEKLRLSPLLVSLTCAFAASYPCGIKHSQRTQVILPRSCLADQWSLVICSPELRKLPL